MQSLNERKRLSEKRDAMELMWIMFSPPRDVEAADIHKFRHKTKGLTLRLWENSISDNIQHLNLGHSCGCGEIAYLILVNLVI